MLCGNPPLLSSEKPKDYESLFSHMADCVEPTDVVEWLWLKDLVDHTWEIRRLRRFKNQLIEIGLPSPESKVDRYRQLVADVRMKMHENHPERFAKPEEAPEKPKKRERKRPPSAADEVKSFRQCINDYQTLDRLLISAEERRDALLREIERRRDGLGQRLRGASDDIIDAEFSETAIAAE
jgi:hypothetical protein